MPYKWILLFFFIFVSADCRLANAQEGHGLPRKKYILAGSPVVGVEVTSSSECMLKVAGNKVKSVKIYGQQRDLSDLMKSRGWIYVWNCECERLSQVRGIPLGDCILSRAIALPVPATLAKLASGHLAVIVEDPEDFVDLFYAASGYGPPNGPIDPPGTSGAGPQPGKTPGTSEAPLPPNGDSDCAGARRSKVCLDSNGVISFSVACEGFEFSVSSSGKIDLALKGGRIKLTATVAGGN
jgi:hypothetical protein